MIHQALKEIKRATAEIIDEQKIETLVKKYYETGKTYTVKAGFDPTGSNLHLGHTLLLQKLKIFQKHGGRVQLIIGDFTAKIGDPTGKSQTRKVMDYQTVLENAKTYQEQVFKIIDQDKTDILYNSKWLEKMGSAGMLELTTHYNVARMLERDDFDKRYKGGKSISVSEFIYPLLQGYDSVELKSDIEIGGTDQKFNLIVGRHLQRTYETGKEQAILMMPILEGLDGVQKMSKSLDNYIGITEEAKDIYGKVLSISDELMWRYYDLLSELDLEEISKLKEGVKNGEIHPKGVKENLALELTSRFHTKEKSLEAKKEFDSVFTKNELPEYMEEFEMEEGVWVCQALVDAKLSPSTSQARRDIEQNGVRMNQTKIVDFRTNLSKGEHILQVGRRKFAKVIVIEK